VIPEGRANQHGRAHRHRQPGCLVLAMAVFVQLPAGEARHLRHSARAHLATSGGCSSRPVCLSYGMLPGQLGGQAWQHPGL